MLRRKHTAFQSVTCLTRSLQATSSCCGLTESPRKTSAVQRGMFSSLQLMPEEAGLERREKDNMSSEVMCPIRSFIQSYIKAKKKYPAIKLVAQETGAPKMTVKRVLDKIKSYPGSMDTESPFWTANLFATSDAESNQTLKNREDLFPLSELLKEKGIVDGSDKDSVEIFDAFNNKENAMKKTAPLIEVLEQTRSGSRRVNFSAWKGLAKESNWEDTLASISPSSLYKSQELVNNDIGSTESISRETEEKSDSSVASIISTPTACMDNTPSTLDVQYKVKLVATRRRTIIASVSTPKLLATLKAKSPVFLDLHDKIDRILHKDAPIHAFLYFKTKEGMREALKLKAIEIDGEHLLFKYVDFVFPEEEILEPGCDVTKVSAVAKGAIIKGGIFYASDITTWDASVLQKVVTIDVYQTNIPPDSVHQFFAIFGALKVFPENETFQIKFERSKPRSKVLKIHQFEIDKYLFKIRTDVSPGELVVRLTSEDGEAEVAVAKKACWKYGSIAYIQKIEDGVLDAHYKILETKNVDRILKGLWNDPALKGMWIPSLRCEGYEVCSIENKSINISPIGDIMTNDIEKLLHLSQELSQQVAKICSYTRSDKPATDES